LAEYLDAPLRQVATSWSVLHLNIRIFFIHVC
jgi:hypothetical protein